MAQFRTSRVFDVVFVLLLGLFLWWAALHRQPIGDWVYFLRYQPPPNIVKIADDAALAPYGRKLFYRTNPTLGSKTQIVAECDIERLGCINPKGQVFILDEPSKPNQTVVTAAHEMLHLAYRRLSNQQKE